jgi:hypothetical protein
MRLRVNFPRAGGKLEGGSGCRLAVEHNCTICEWDWLRVGSPYFKVYPAIVPLLSSVGIDVPGLLLSPPDARWCNRAIDAGSQQGS